MIWKIHFGNAYSMSEYHYWALGIRRWENMNKKERWVERRVMGQESRWGGKEERLRNEERGGEWRMSLRGIRYKDCLRRDYNRCWYDPSNHSIARKWKSSAMVAGSHCHIQCIDKVLNLLPMMPCVWRSPPLHSEEHTGLSHLSVSHGLSVFCLEAASDHALTYPYLIYYLLII